MHTRPNGRDGTVAAITILGVVLAWLAIDDIISDTSTSFDFEWATLGLVVLALTAAGVGLLLRPRRRPLGAGLLAAVAVGVLCRGTIDRVPGWDVAEAGLRVSLLAAFLVGVALALPRRTAPALR